MAQIKVIPGNKGSGKTKKLIDLANEAVKTCNGNVVCIEKGMKLTLELDHNVRLIVTDEYDINGFCQFYGFIAGVLAGNYDIKEVFIDGILKIGNKDMAGLSDFIAKVKKLIADNDVNFTITVSADVADIPEDVKQYII